MNHEYVPFELLFLRSDIPMPGDYRLHDREGRWIIERVTIHCRCCGPQNASGQEPVIDHSWSSHAPQKEAGLGRVMMDRASSPAGCSVADFRFLLRRTLCHYY